MARNIEFSPRNKAFITRLVTAFENKDVPGFAETFSKHSDPSAYKHGKSLNIPTDFALLGELFQNIDVFDQDDVLVLLLAIPHQTPLSLLTKMALYMIAYTHVAPDERTKLFDHPGALQITPDEISASNTHIRSAQWTVKTEIWNSFRPFYEYSVDAGQSPADFLNKFELCASAGLDFYHEINDLCYRPDLGEKTESQLYLEILSRVSEDDARRFCEATRLKMINYDLLKFFGVLELSKVHGNSFSSKFLPEAFAEVNVDIFNKIAKQSLNNMPTNDIKHLTHTMMTSMGDKGPSAEQFGMLQSLDEIINKRIITAMTSGLETRHSHFILDFAMDCIAFGEERMLTNFFEENSQEAGPYLIHILRYLSQCLPGMIEDGLIGETQVRMTEYLHRLAINYKNEFANRIESIDTGHSYRIGKGAESGKIKAISELSADERSRWAESRPIPDPKSMPMLPDGFHVLQMKRQRYISERYGGGPFFG